MLRFRFECPPLPLLCAALDRSSPGQQLAVFLPGELRASVGASQLRCVKWRSAEASEAAFGLRGPGRRWGFGGGLPTPLLRQSQRVCITRDVRLAARMADCTCGADASGH